MATLREDIDRIAADEHFSGVVRVDVDGTTVLAAAFGDADRRHRIPNEMSTRIGVASGAKCLTAVMVMRLIEHGVLRLDTTARSLLSADLPLIDDTVTIEHLLAHRSGIGDYLDEDLGGDITDYTMKVPVHELDCAERYLRVLDGFPQKFAPGTSFSYCNGGYAVLAILAERAAQTPFTELVRTLVSDPAGMHDSAFLRSDELPGDAAIGYLATSGLRTNALHLPLVGTGDGGLYSTAADFNSYWAALFEGRIVAPETLAEMVTPRSSTGPGRRNYGLCFSSLHSSTDGVFVEGFDAGASFRSAHRPSTRTTYSVLSNCNEGAWALVDHLDETFLS